MKAAVPCARQHGRAEIDSDHGRVERVEREIAASPDPGIQQVAGEAVEEQGPQRAIAPVLER